MGIDIYPVYRRRPPKCYGQMARDWGGGADSWREGDADGGGTRGRRRGDDGVHGGRAGPAAGDHAGDIDHHTGINTRIRTGIGTGRVRAGGGRFGRAVARGRTHPVLPARHHRSEPAGRRAPDLNDRSTQRNLSDRGRAQATGMGTAIRALGIPIGDVLASPYARAVETGELAFGSGRVRASRDLLNEAYPGTDDADLARQLRRLLGQRPPAGQNTVLIGHGFNITEATGITIAEGECAVFEPTDEGGFRLVARLTAQRWSELARPR